MHERREVALRFGGKVNLKNPSVPQGPRTSSGLDTRRSPAFGTPLRKGRSHHFGGPCFDEIALIAIWPGNGHYYFGGELVARLALISPKRLNSN